MAVIIETVPFITKEALDSVNALAPQHSPEKEAIRVSWSELDETLRDRNFRLFFAYDTETGAVVGMASIFFQRNIVRWIAEIHDVVVDNPQRGRGIGKQLTQACIATAQNVASSRGRPIKLYLTSRPIRIHANAMYQNLGFTLVATAHGEWGTNLYKMTILPS